MQIIFLLLAVFGCPIVFVALVSRMKAQGINKPPVIPMFFLFGTIGGWLLAFGLDGMPSWLCYIFLVTVAPITLFVASLGIGSMKNKTIYHQISMWCGFSYPVLVGLLIAFDRNQNAEQDVAPNRSLPPSQNSTSSFRGSED